MSAAVGARGPEAGARRSARKTGPEVRPRSRRGRRRAVPVAQWTYSIAPPLEWTRPRRNSRSRSSMLRDRSSSARAAVSYSTLSMRVNGSTWTWLPSPPQPGCREVASTRQVGKTQLAVEYAHRFAPDYQLVDQRGSAGADPGPVRGARAQAR